MNPEPPTISDRWMTRALAAKHLAEELLEFVTQMSYEIDKDLQDAPAGVDEPVMCDVGYLLREIENVLDGTRKECAFRRDQVSKVLSVRVTKRAMQGGEPKVKGELATGTPDVKLAPQLPPRGSKEWTALMRNLGVDTFAIEHELVSIRWPNLRDWLTGLAERGERPPTGVDVRTMPVSTMTYRRRPRKKDDNG